MLRLGATHTRCVLKWATVLIVTAGVQSCGPSVQFIYEGNIRFEHCYRLDFDERIAPNHRKACWEDWLLRFPKAQTRDRREYAKRRIESLASGERATLSLKLDQPAQGEAAANVTNSAAAPANVHAPPPATTESGAPSRPPSGIGAPAKVGSSGP